MTTTIKNIKKSLEKKHVKNTKDFLKKKKKKKGQYHPERNKNLSEEQKQNKLSIWEFII